MAGRWLSLGIPVIVLSVNCGRKVPIFEYPDNNFASDLSQVGGILCVSR